MAGPQWGQPERVEKPGLAPGAALLDLGLAASWGPSILLHVVFTKTELPQNGICTDLSDNWAGTAGAVGAGWTMSPPPPHTKDCECTMHTRTRMLISSTASAVLLSTHASLRGWLELP